MKKTIFALFAVLLVTLLVTCDLLVPPLVDEDAPPPRYRKTGGKW